MNNQSSEKKLDMLLRRTLVPKGYRPTKLDDIEKMLRTIDSEPMSPEKQERMLRKINGVEPVFPEAKPTNPIATGELTPEELELVALHRSLNKPLPSDLEAKIKALEERAAQDPNADEDSQSD